MISNYHQKGFAIFILFSVLLCLLFDRVSGFEKDCQTNQYGDINCSFIVQDKWNFLEFREWLDNIRGSIGSVSLNLTCLNNGTVYMPSPSRARNLEKLYTKNCVIDGYHSEFYNQPAYPDSIRYLTIIDSIFLLDPEQLYDMVLNDSQLKSVHCGHETYVRTIHRNIKYSFLPITTMPSLEKMEAVSDAILPNIKNRPFVCNYQNYIEIESTGSNTVGKYVFDDMTENSLYPSLTKFNYSSNKINNLPRQLSNWWKFFPALRELDLSNDNIESFSFDHPDVKQDFVFISLENNNITSVPADLPTYLNGKTPLVINLLGNPIHCDCKARALSQYLISLQAITPQFYFLSDVKCNSPSTLEGICVKTLNFDYCQA